MSTLIASRTSYRHRRLCRCALVLELHALGVAWALTDVVALADAVICAVYALLGGVQ